MNEVINGEVILRALIEGLPQDVLSSWNVSLEPRLYALEACHEFKLPEVNATDENESDSSVGGEVDV